MSYKARSSNTYSIFELDSLLDEAIHSWNPERPRRWLYCYGYLNDFSRRSRHCLQYQALRNKALQRISKNPSYYAQSWPEEGFKLLL